MTLRADVATRKGLNLILVENPEDGTTLQRHVISAEHIEEDILTAESAISELDPPYRVTYQGKGKLPIKVDTVQARSEGAKYDSIIAANRHLVGTVKDLAGMLGEAHRANVELVKSMTSVATAQAEGMRAVADSSSLSLTQAKFALAATIANQDSKGPTNEGLPPMVEQLAGMLLMAAPTLLEKFMASKAPEPEKKA